jgi:hypothetical protein
METKTIPTQYHGEVHIKTFDTGTVYLGISPSGHADFDVRGSDIEVKDWGDDEVRTVKVLTRSGDEAASVHVPRWVGRTLDVYLSRVRDGHLAE